MKWLPLVFLSLASVASLASEAVAQTPPTSSTNPAYTLHEWGTFTTVSGSGGTLLPGLEREEEGLPWFVESHEGMQNWGGKGYVRPLKNVTVKMETPVIYFYTPTPFQAHVAVDFHGGSISQWYPTRSGGEVPPGRSLAASQLELAGSGGIGGGIVSLKNTRAPSSGTSL